MGDHRAAMYAFTAAFFAQLRSSGVDHAVVSPGARSTPLVVAADKAGLCLWVQLDERSAGFFALGLSRSLRRPVALVCTSGTAAANYLPAVLEADRSGVPLLVLTADRPPEVRRWGSNQTVDQAGLYGSAPRWFAETPVASESVPAVARRFAARAAAVAASPPAGPVHLNFPLREPLAPGGEVSIDAEALPRPVAVHAGSGPPAEMIDEFVGLVDRFDRGLIVAGAVNPGEAAVVDTLALAAAARWPVLAEPTSQLRVAAPESGATVVSTATHLVDHRGFADAHAPEAVVLLGAAPPHRALRSWLKSLADCRVILVGDGVEWRDESFMHTDVFRCAPGQLFAAASPRLGASSSRAAWETAWQEADTAAAAAIGRSLIAADLFEGRIVTALAGVVPDDASLQVGNSMAVRDFGLFWPRRDRPIDIYANRGASGIDGMVSSALGVAAGTDKPVVAYLGDLSLLHDLSGLLCAVRYRIPLVVVVANNDGGGIFSFLPIAQLGESVRFEELFHTPHGADLGSVVSGIGAAHRIAASSAEVQAAVIEALDAAGPTVVEVKIDSARSVAAHRAVDAAVRRALDAL